MDAQLAPLEVIERTRRREPVDAASVESFARSWIDGTSADALMAGWCMAACLSGLEPAAVEGLLRALIGSGERLSLDALGPTGDVHSTGGVGDTTPLVAVPLAAALGVRVVSIADRGRAHCGGTVDKLEAIAGFQVDMSLGSLVRQVRDIGIAVIGNTPRLVPGDRRLRALRSATATAPAAGLIAASIMSRALASGAGALSLHVLRGEGGLLAGEQADEAAELMARLAEPWGRALRWTVSAIDQPLGRCIGSALEVAEAGEVLRGGGPRDTRELAIRIAGDLAEAAGALAQGQGRGAAADALGDGRGLAAAERWIEAQGGDPAVWTERDALPSAQIRIGVNAPAAGWISQIRAGEVGEVARWLGVGRLHPDQAVDPVVGIELLAKVGDRVEDGDPVAVIHARDEWAGQRAMEMAERCIVVSDAAVAVPPLILGEGRSDP